MFSFNEIRNALRANEFDTKKAFESLEVFAAAGRKRGKPIDEDEEDESGESDESKKTRVEDKRDYDAPGHFQPFLYSLSNLELVQAFDLAEVKVKHGPFGVRVSPKSGAAQIFAQRIKEKGGPWPHFQLIEWAAATGDEQLLKYFLHRPTKTYRGYTTRFGRLVRDPIAGQYIDRSTTVHFYDVIFATKGAYEARLPEGKLRDILSRIAHYVTFSSLQKHTLDAQSFAREMEMLTDQPSDVIDTVWRSFTEESTRGGVPISTARAVVITKDKELIQKYWNYLIGLGNFQQFGVMDFFADEEPVDTFKVENISAMVRQAGILGDIGLANWIIGRAKWATGIEERLEMHKYLGLAIGGHDQALDMIDKILALYATDPTEFDLGDDFQLAIDYVDEWETITATTFDIFYAAMLRGSHRELPNLVETHLYLFLYSKNTVGFQWILEKFPARVERVLEAFVDSEVHGNPRVAEFEYPDISTAEWLPWVKEIFSSIQPSPFIHNLLRDI